MALTQSAMIPLGTKAPHFSLLDVISKQIYSYDDLKSSTATLVLFICNHCPYVKHIQSALIDFANDYLPKGVSIIAINSNDAVQYPEDSPEKMQSIARQFNYPFPYLYDEDQSVAKTYQAACTPEFYLFDQHDQCVYRGQFDDSRPGNDQPTTGRDLRLAVDHLLAGKPINANQKPGIGCNIKWKTKH